MGPACHFKRGRKKLVRATTEPAPLERTKGQGHTVSKGAGRAQLGGGQCWVGRGSEAARAAGPDGEFTGHLTARTQSSATGHVPFDCVLALHIGAGLAALRPRCSPLRFEVGCFIHLTISVFVSLLSRLCPPTGISACISHSQS